MEYLTTHDLVWINQSVIGQVAPYDYFDLEACMAGQYRYGESQNVLEQAATLLERILFKRPFLHGNRRTALIATLTFLNANGYATKVGSKEAAQLLLETANGRNSPAEAIAALAAPAQKTLAAIPLRRLITFECNAHADALQALAAGD